VGGILMAAAVLGLIVNVLELILGIAGLKRSGDPRKTGFFITTGIIISALALITMIIGISGGNIGWTSLVNFVLAILYIVGGAMNRRAALE
jgi:hypothetical protein